MQRHRPRTALTGFHKLASHNYSSEARTVRPGFLVTCRVPLRFLPTERRNGTWLRWHKANGLICQIAGALRVVRAPSSILP
jgi:hypothetical protein